jgi:hypothetical protein
VDGVVAAGAVATGAVAGVVAAGAVATGAVAGVVSGTQMMPVPTYWKKPAAPFTVHALPITGETVAGAVAAGAGATETVVNGMHAMVAEPLGYP